MFKVAASNHKLKLVLKNFDKIIKHFGPKLDALGCESLRVIIMSEDSIAVNVTIVRDSKSDDNYSIITPVYIDANDETKMTSIIGDELVYRLNGRVYHSTNLESFVNFEFNYNEAIRIDVEQLGV